MIKKFSVKNFKNFKDTLILDFSKVRDYGFNCNFIKNGLINKALLYGENNCGKSNLGFAIMDIATHLTDNHITSGRSNLYYLNGDSNIDCASFSYEFLFDNKNVTYSYKKDSNMNLLEEILMEDDKLLFKYNYENNKYENNISNALTIDISKRSSNMSVLKYIYTNTLYWEDDSAVKLLMDFVSNMLWFRSLRNNEFIGPSRVVDNLHEYIINNNLLKDFQRFLKGCGQDYNLCEISEGGKSLIGVKYKNYSARFDVVASTGTGSLWLFYYWMNKIKNVSFLFLDEFDAFYHYELSLYILRYINNCNSFQSIMTTHNTYLIDNELMRPDCYLKLKDGKVTSFADSTKKTIRQAHNLEKMMLGGEFEK